MQASTGGRTVVIVSGGLDSTVLLYLVASWGSEIQALSFNYGQRHARELVEATDICHELHIKHRIISLTDLTSLFEGSSLTDATVAVPEGHYAAETMKATVVPNRNAIMLSIAYGVAVAQHAGGVVYGAHAGDHTIYPDCRPEFVEALSKALHEGNKGFGNPHLSIYAPFALMSKADIVRTGAKLKVPFARTWSCYKGGDTHCGRCATCIERRQAFLFAGVKDPTKYLTSWKESAYIGGLDPVTGVEVKGTTHGV